MPSPSYDGNLFFSTEMNRDKKFIKLSFVLLLLGVFPISTFARPFFLVLSEDDFNLNPVVDGFSPEWDPLGPDFDEFIDADSKSDYELDPGSWSPMFEPDSSPYLNFSNGDGEGENGISYEEIYYKVVRRIVNAASRGDDRAMAEAASEIEAIAEVTGNPHAQSVMGLLYGMGIMRDRSKAKAFLNHYFAAEGGNMQSKMALAYIYYRQNVSLI